MNTRDSERISQGVEMAMYTDAHLTRGTWNDEMYPTFYDYLQSQLRIAEERASASLRAKLEAAERVIEAARKIANITILKFPTDHWLYSYLKELDAVIAAYDKESQDEYTNI